jgi:hypothetical protein
MQHYNIARWLDFVRGVCSRAERRALQRHLASPCRACGRQVEILRRILRAAEADSQVPEIPSSVVQFVHDLFPLRLPRVRLTPRAQIKLVFDSFRSQPAAEKCEA